MRTGIAAAAVAASFALAFVVAAPVLAYQHSGTMSSNMTMGGDKTGTMTSGFMDHSMLMSWFNDTGKMFGVISSIQNDENGEPAWLTTGYWTMTNGIGSSNATETAGTEITDFYAGFQMIMLDGTAGHTHEIYDFAQEGDSTTEGNVTMVTGTSTVTMREGPVEDVDTEITISEGRVIAISLDQEALENHFGDTPIYGIVITPEMIQHMMNMTTMTSSAGNTTGMMGEMWK
jgi:hypothetical protein